MMQRVYVLRNYAAKKPFLRSSPSDLSSNSNKPAPVSGEPRRFEVVLDNETLYIPKELASALGWNPDAGNGTTGVSLSLHGWEPAFFAIAPTGSDSELLARNTVQSGRDPKVIHVLDYLKDR